MLGLAMSLAGCAFTPAGPPGHRAGAASPDEAVTACRALFERIDAAVAQAGVADAQYARIAGYPYLRVSRLLAGPLKPARDGGRADFDDWVDALAALDEDARSIELANLGSTAPETSTVRRAQCARLLAAADLEHAAGRAALLEAAVVPDAYVTAQRVLGLYPITSLFFLAGVERLHEERARDFAMPLSDVPVEGRLIRYVPRAAAPDDGAGPLARRDAADIVRGLVHAPPAAQRAALVSPRAMEPRLAALLAAFAPVLEVDTVTGDDRIGAPVWSGPPGSASIAPASVDPTRPAAYAYFSMTAFDGVLLPQLVYVFWFPARPASGPWDLLSGRLDGLTYRVTLDADGAVLVRDTMHNCGCFHLFVPGERLRRRDPLADAGEPPFVPQTISAATPWPARTVIRVSSGAHYVQRMYVERMSTVGGAGGVERAAYTLTPYRELRALPLPGGGTRSLFRPDGIVAGTERGERFFFWPMGVPGPGEMRQRGHHAIAFVGRRHFDSPDLVERFFERAGAPAFVAGRRP